MDINGRSTHVSPWQKPGVGQYTINIYIYIHIHTCTPDPHTWNFMIPIELITWFFIYILTSIHCLFPPGMETPGGNDWGPRVVEPEVCHSHWWPRQLEREAKPQQCNGRPHQGPRWQWRSQHKCHVAQREPAIHLEPKMAVGVASNLAVRGQWYCHFVIL